jgi:tetratricopeptide (TPR) repeat protein
MLQEKYPEAITAFSRFIAARPDTVGAYFYLGIAFDKLDEVEKAISHYQRFLALDQGKSDKQSFQARERIKVLEKKKKKR